jgi:hypothetical protein
MEQGRKAWNLEPKKVRDRVAAEKTTRAAQQDRAVVAAMVKAMVKDKAPLVAKVTVRAKVADREETGKADS